MIGKFSILLLLSIFCGSIYASELKLSIYPPIKRYIKIVVRYTVPATNYWKIKLIPSDIVNGVAYGNHWFGPFYVTSSINDLSKPFNELSWLFPAVYTASFFKAELTEEK